jgi:Rap1a immunity proteins
MQARSSSRFAIALTATLGLAVAWPAAAQAPAAPAAVGAETFRAGTTGALGQLCGSGTSSAVGTAANVYCHGFLSGVGQFHREVTREGGPLAPLYCAPQPPPPVEQVASAFAAWARANPQHAGEPAVDGLIRFAQATYPCPPRPAAARRSRAR